MRCRRCPAQVAALHAVSVGSRPYGRRCCLRAAPRGLATPPRAGAAPVGGRPCRRQPWPRGCPLQWAAATCGLATGGCPLRSHRGQQALAGWPLAAAPCRLIVIVQARGWPQPLQMATPCRWPGRSRSPPCGRAVGRRSYIPVFQIRMEKMKEVKRPPL
ncbi:hypothetical protein GW17_00053978 [Ensete ventricosum]|nr:hypothetical protein GW17_00053978 [Ensete ventricosum]